jgi:hypothetical protein
MTVVRVRPTYWNTASGLDSAVAILDRHRIGQFQQRNGAFDAAGLGDQSVDRGLNHCIAL